ncbi:MAG: PspC domain-containing protein [Acidobacteriaceae bacterium]
MFCHQCGKPLPAGANFCANCGAQVNASMPASNLLTGMLRPRANRIFAGVCAAIHVRYGWDLLATRILAVLLGVLLFPLGEIAYLVGWLLIPEEAALVPQSYSDLPPR